MGRERDEGWIMLYRQIKATLRITFFRMKIRVSSKFLGTFMANYSIINSLIFFTFYKM